MDSEEIISEDSDFTLTGEVVDECVVALTMYLSEAVIESNRNKASRPDHDDSTMRWILFEENIIPLHNFLGKVIEKYF